MNPLIRIALAIVGIAAMAASPALMFPAAPVWFGWALSALFLTGLASVVTSLTA